MLKRNHAVLISPEEALHLNEHATIEEMYIAMDLYEAYREQNGVNNDPLLDTMSVLSFIYDTARIQGIREERARKKL